MSLISFNSIQDAYISSFFPDKNFGSNNSLFVGQFQNNTDNYRSLLSFDINSIPAGSTIISAKLKLYIYRNDFPATSKSLNIYQLLNYFKEDNVTYSNQPIIPSSPESSITITSELNTYIEWNITNLVTGWYKGNIPNTGLMIVGLETAPSLVGFRSKEFNDSRGWPILQVEYALGNITQYPVEIVTTTDDFTGSTPILLGPKTATFGIQNIGTSNNAQVVLQLSPDGITWIDNMLPFATPPVFYPGTNLILNSYGHMNYARVSFKSDTPGNPTQLSIYAVTKE